MPVCLKTMLLKLIDSELLIIAFIGILLVFVCAGPCVFQSRGDVVRPIPKEQWDADTRLWTARAMVGEVDWDSEQDHAAIAWVLARRWKMASKRWPELRYVDVVRGYSKPIRGSIRRLTRRQRWVRALSIDGARPAGWPRRLAWNRYAPKWRRVLRMADEWSLGLWPDPCRGKAWHWGGQMDRPWPGLVEIDCGDTRNVFYALASIPE